MGGLPVFLATSIAISMLRVKRLPCSTCHKYECKLFIECILSKDNYFVKNYYLLILTLGLSKDNIKI